MAKNKRAQVEKSKTNGLIKKFKLKPLRVDMTRRNIALDLANYFVVLQGWNQQNNFLLPAYVPLLFNKVQWLYKQTQPVVHLRLLEPRYYRDVYDLIKSPEILSEFSNIENHLALEMRPKDARNSDKMAKRVSEVYGKLNDETFQEAELYKKIKLVPGSFYMTEKSFCKFMVKKFLKQRKLTRPANKICAPGLEADIPSTAVEKLPTIVEESEVVPSTSRVSPVPMIAEQSEVVTSTAHVFAQPGSLDEISSSVPINVEQSEVVPSTAHDFAQPGSLDEISSSVPTNVEQSEVVPSTSHVLSQLECLVEVENVDVISAPDTPQMSNNTDLDVEPDQLQLFNLLHSDAIEESDSSDDFSEDHDIELSTDNLPDDLMVHELTPPLFHSTPLCDNFIQVEENMNEIPSPSYELLSPSVVIQNQTVIEQLPSTHISQDIAVSSPVWPELQIPDSSSDSSSYSDVTVILSQANMVEHVRPKLVPYSDSESETEQEIFKCNVVPFGTNNLISPAVIPIQPQGSTSTESPQTQVPSAETEPPSSPDRESIKLEKHNFMFSPYHDSVEFIPNSPVHSIVIPDSPTSPRDFLDTQTPESQNLIPPILAVRSSPLCRQTRSQSVTTGSERDSESLVTSAAANVSSDVDVSYAANVQSRATLQKKRDENKKKAPAKTVAQIVGLKIPTRYGNPIRKNMVSDRNAPQEKSIPNIPEINNQMSTLSTVPIENRAIDDLPSSLEIPTIEKSPPSNNRMCPPPLDLNIQESDPPRFLSESFLQPSYDRNQNIHQYTKFLNCAFLNEFTYKKSKPHYADAVHNEFTMLATFTTHGDTFYADEIFIPQILDLDRKAWDALTNALSCLETYTFNRKVTTKSTPCVVQDTLNLYFKSLPKYFSKTVKIAKNSNKVIDVYYENVSDVITQEKHSKQLFERTIDPDVLKVMKDKLFLRV